MQHLKYVYLSITKESIKTNKIHGEKRKTNRTFNPDANLNRQGANKRTYQVNQKYG